MDNENNIRKVQIMTLSLLEKYISICDEYKLRYYLVGGALIGGFRHNGFIPWDDDIDVIMPRKDYEKFIEIINRGIPGGYSICNRFTDKNWHFAISQFIDLESEVEIHLAERSRRAHIWIDIFPADGSPDNKIKRFFHIKRILLYRYMIQIANIKLQVDAYRKRPFHERAILRVASIIPLGDLINTDKTLDKLEKHLKAYDFDTSAYVGDFLGRYREKEIMPYRVFGVPSKHRFEGIEVSVPQDSDYFLRKIYGDYMRIPPKEEQVAHGVRIIKMR